MFLENLTAHSAAALAQKHNNTAFFPRPEISRKDSGIRIQDSVETPSIRIGKTKYAAPGKKERVTDSFILLSGSFSDSLNPES
jgi:hypothetical protein